MFKQVADEVVAHPVEGSADGAVQNIVVVGHFDAAQQARINFVFGFDTLAEATADVSHIYATTVRKRGVTKAVLTPEAAANEIVHAQGRSAILFGAERSGLETDEVAVARSIITVPINPEFGSLNLAQAVILCAYEWSKHQGLESPPKTELDPPAPQEELDGMIDQLFGLLDQRNFFYPPERTNATRLTLRNLLTKPGWNSLELRTLRGVWSSFRDRRS